MKASAPPSKANGLLASLRWDTAPTKTSYIGIDGARGGWVVGVIDGSEVSLLFVEKLCELILPTTSRVLIDMPIGLPETGRRRCDSEARVLLGSRRSTLFPVPSRSAVFASSYEECCAMNLTAQGCKVSKQSWNIAPKIQELDAYLDCDPAQHSFIAEGHPELAFRALSPIKEPLLPKRTAEGRDQRIRCIDRVTGTSCSSMSRDFLAQYRQRVDVSDILDALSLAALLSVSQGAVGFVGDGAADGHGHPMRICAG